MLEEETPLDECEEGYENEVDTVQLAVLESGEILLLLDNDGEDEPRVAVFDRAGFQAFVSAAAGILAGAQDFVSFCFVDERCTYVGEA